MAEALEAIIVMLNLIQHLILVQVFSINNKTTPNNRFTRMYFGANPDLIRVNFR